jgi:large subunit ribosomal protein L32
MAVPKQKISKSRRDMRRAHHRLRPAGYVECSNCGEAKRSHHICRACGHYGDKGEVIEGAGSI